MRQPKLKPVFTPPPTPEHHHEGPCQCEPTIGYIRVSMVGDRDVLLSPEIQADYITRYAIAKGKRIVKFVCDLDKSGRVFTKRSIDGLIADIKRGVAKSVTVWKWSRWGRNVEFSLLYISKVKAVGGEVESATEDMDQATAAGRFSRGVMMQVDEFYSDLIGESWQSSHDKRRAAGLPHSGRARFGYQYISRAATKEPGDAHDGASDCAACIQEVAHFLPHPTEGPMLESLYRRYIAGGKAGSLRGMAAGLNAAGFVTALGGPWTPQALGQSLDTGFAAGLIRERSPELIALHKAQGRTVRNSLSSFDVWRQGGHPALIDEKTWQDYRARRLSQAATPPRSRVAVHALSALLVCDECARRLGTKYSGAKLSHQWVCGWRSAYHPAVSVQINNDAALGVVRDWVRAMAEEEPLSTGESMDDLLHREQADQEQPARRTRAQVQADVNRWLKKIGNLLGLLTDEIITRDDYQITHAEYAAELTKVKAELAEVDAAPRSDGRPAYEVFASLDEVWDALEPTELNNVLSAVVGMVIVQPSDQRRTRTRASAASRVRVVGRWELPSWERWLAARRVRALA